MAVISVLLFHAGFDWFAGGFVGVDVFFVISGYLIIGHIRSEIEAGRFSTASFYERRARRILPALFTVVTASSVAAYFLLLPDELAAYGKSVLAAAASVSNVIFYRESGYFDAPAETKPLLHTWSLAIEEQFYLLLPPTLLVLNRLTRRGTGILLALITLGSFALNVWMVDVARSAAFYLLPTRAWELFLGGLLGFLPTRQLSSPVLREVLASVGLTLMLVAVLAFGPATPFPGAPAMLPCLGTAILIQTGGAHASPWVNRFLALRPFVAVGLISYSLYLWHWPALVFTKAFLIHPMSGPTAALVLLASTAAAALSWRYVEQPFRRRGRLSRRSVYVLSAAALAVLGTTGLGFWQKEGLPSRLPAEVQTLTRTPRSAKTGLWCPEITLDEKQHVAPCVVEGRAGRDPTTLLWGDSHAGALAGAMRDLWQTRGRALAVAWMSACAPVLGVERSDSPATNCATKNDAVLRWMAENESIEVVVLAGRWGLWAEGDRYGQEPGAPATLWTREASGQASQRQQLEEGLRRTVAAVRRLGARVKIWGPFPEIGLPVPQTLARVTWWRRGIDIRPTVGDYTARQEFVLSLLDELAALPNVEILHPEAVLCESERCRVDLRSAPLYADDNHLSAPGADFVVGRFADELLR